MALLIRHEPSDYQRRELVAELLARLEAHGAAVPGRLMAENGRKKWQSDRVTRS